MHWTVHCACTVRALRKTRSLCNSASGGVEAQSLFVGSSCEDESAFGLGFWHVQKGICSSLHLHSQKKNIVLLCWVAALKMSVCLDWGCGKCKREFVQACVCTSINRKLFPGLSPGSSQQTAILSNSLRRNLHAPSPNSMLLRRFAWKGRQKKTAISVRMPACIRQQHWSRGRGGIRCDVTTCRRMAVFFWRTRYHRIS